MPLARLKLEQRRGRALARPLALCTDKTASEIVHACCADAAERGEIDIALGLASAALDLQPWEPAIDRLIYRRPRIDRAAVCPKSFIPALTEKVVGFPDQRLALAPLADVPIAARFVREVSLETSGRDARGSSSVMRPVRVRARRRASRTDHCLRP